VELRDYLHVFRRRWRWVAFGLIVCVALAEAFVLRATPQYQSQTQIFISTSSSDTATANAGNLFSMQRVASYADLANGRDLASNVVDDLDLDVTPAQLASKVTAQAVPETVLLQITITDPDPELARDIAASYADELADLVAELETPPGKDKPVLKATTVESANVPTAPVSPNVVRTLLMGAVLGLMLGFGLAAIRELLDTSLKTADDIEAITPAPILGWIQNDAVVTKEPLISTMSPHHPRVESFRVLRTNLQFVDVDAQSKAFVVSSAVPGEGKSSTATNIAITLAMAGVRVLLVDGDLRRPRASAILGVDEAVGLTTVLVGQLTAADVIQEHPTGLHVMASGAVPPNPAELLQSQAMTDLISTLRTSYDVVIFDAPPLLPVTDAALLASKTDGAILVVRHGKTSREQVRGACERLTQIDAAPLGVVFNRVPQKGGGDGYGYGYGYGYAPVEPEAPEGGKRKGNKPSKVKADKGAPVDGPVDASAER
jgi:receptor protein-tyrosine kinase